MEDEEQPLIRALPRAASQQRRHERTLFVHWLAAAVDGADKRLLAALFRALEASFGFGPADLGMLMVGQNLALALSAPVWGQLADASRERIRLLAAGSALWGLWTALFAGATSFYQMLALRVLTGAALSAVTPISQSVVADIATAEQRGRQFGLIGASDNLGSLLGGIFATTVGGTMVGALDGWRFVFLVLAAVSFVLAAIAPCVATDPRADAPRAADGGARGLRGQLRSGWRKAAETFRVRTFLLIVSQGIFGSVPWNALSFSTMWLQYVGFSDASASLVTGMAILGVCLGNILGGYLGDAAAARLPDTGRVRVAQTSVALGTLLQPVILYGLPWDPNWAPAYGFVFFLQGLVCSWCFAATNRPIFSELVPPASRASLLSWAVAVEGASASIFGAPVVGLLAEKVFGYTPRRGEVGALGEAVKARNAAALAHAMLYMTVVPWICCFLLYNLVVYTYGPDRDAVRKQSEGKA